MGALDLLRILLLTAALPQPDLEDGHTVGSTSQGNGEYFVCVFVLCRFRRLPMRFIAAVLCRVEFGTVVVR